MTVAMNRYYNYMQMFIGLVCMNLCDFVFVLCAYVCECVTFSISFFYCSIGVNAENAICVCNNPQTN